MNLLDFPETLKPEDHGEIVEYIDEHLNILQLGRINIRKHEGVPFAVIALKLSEDTPLLLFQLTTEGEGLKISPYAIHELREAAITLCGIRDDPEQERHTQLYQQLRRIQRQEGTSVLGVRHINATHLTLMRLHGKPLTLAYAPT